jgi:hypothetical protein
VNIAGASAHVGLLAVLDVLGASGISSTAAPGQVKPVKNSHEWFASRCGYNDALYRSLRSKGSPRAHTFVMTAGSRLDMLSISVPLSYAVKPQASAILKQSYYLLYSFWG